MEMVCIPCRVGGVVKCSILSQEVVMGSILSQGGSQVLDFEPRVARGGAARLQENLHAT